MVQPAYEAWSGIVAGNPDSYDPTSDALIPHVVIARGERPLTFEASLALGTASEGIPGALSLPPEHVDRIWIPPAAQGYTIGVDGAHAPAGPPSDKWIHVVRPTRGEPFQLSTELLRAVRGLAVEHDVELAYAPAKDGSARSFAVAAAALVKPADRPVAIEHNGELVRT